MNKALTLFTFGALVSFYSHFALAQDFNTEHHLIHFEINQQTEVQNDVVTTQLQAYAESNHAKDVMKQLNEKMQKALSVLKDEQDIQTQTGTYRVMPVLNKDKTTAYWKGTQTLTLTTQKLPGLVILLPKIQPFLHYVSMQFSPSEEVKQKAQADLLQTAIKAYQEKALAIAKGFNASNYQLLETRIHPQNIPRTMVYEARMAKTASAALPPQISPGSSSLSVQISGTLALPK